MRLPPVSLGLLAVALATYGMPVAGQGCVFDPPPLAANAPMSADTMTEISGLSDPDGDGFAPVVLHVPNGAVKVLSTLSRSSSGSSSLYIPVARSYDGYNWERSAGPDAPKIDPDMTDCCLGKCLMYVPYDADYTYYLKTSSNSLLDRDLVSRFLERSTFGPTLDEIDGWDYEAGTELTFARWVRGQMDSDGTSSHREFYRRHTNSRSTEAYMYGLPGPMPCEKNARYRRFAFTLKDKYVSMKENTKFRNRDTYYNTEPFTVDVETRNHLSNPSASSRVVLSFRGSVRTVLKDTVSLVAYGDWDGSNWVNNINVADGSYELCGVEEIVGEYRGLGLEQPRTLSLTVDGVCRHIQNGNPPVHLDHNYVGLSELHVLDLSLLSMGSGHTDIVVLNEEKTFGSDLLLTVPVDSPDCDTFPDSDDNDFRGSDINHNSLGVPYGNPYPYPEYSCSKFDPDAPVFALLPDSTYAIHDLRVVLSENTIDNPLMDGGGAAVLRAAGGGDNQVVYCANAAMNPFNERGCKLSHDPNACRSYNEALGHGLFLDEVNLKMLDDVTDRSFYAVSGLVYDYSPLDPISRPCDYNSRSRWVPVADSVCSGPKQSTCVTSKDCIPEITVETRDAFVKWIHVSNHDNVILRDVYFRGSCDSNDRSKFGMAVMVEEEDQCYLNVHPDHMSVYDVTDCCTNGLTFDTSGSDNTGVAICADCTMAEWEEAKDEGALSLTFLGHYGDTLSFDLLPDSLKNSDAVRTALGFHSISMSIDSSKGGVLVCGSEGEVAPDPLEDDHFNIENRWYDSGPDISQGKQTVWTHLALTATDQLRQRVAWAFAQMITMDNSHTNEPLLSYYDIFVKNAFGNYRELLRQASFHRKLAMMFTYYRSSSSAFKWFWMKDLMFPDENYAREVMQLFSIGLVKLNLDGTPVLDRFGREIPTYDIEDVASLARVWTGFEGSLRRGNYEDLDWAGDSYMDPMRIILKAHDSFPKRGLDNSYIGDKYPLCADMPNRAFLRIGAKYRLLGGSSAPILQEDPVQWDEDDSVKRMILDPVGNSPLRDQLCHAVDSECTYPPIVELTSNLDCHETECLVDTIRVVQVAQGVFYEYVRRPCVQLAFYENAKKIFAGNRQYAMCANPKMAVARPACCGLSWSPDWPTHRCEYAGERVKYDTYEDRCSKVTGPAPLSKEASICEPTKFVTPSWVYSRAGYEWLGTEETPCTKDSRGASPHWIADSNFIWTPSPCYIEIAVNSVGYVQLIHKNDLETQASHHVDGSDNINWFSVHWARNSTGDEQYPSATHNSCWEGACTVDEDVDPYGRVACRCTTTLEETAVFTETPTREEALAQLHVGAFEVVFFDDEEYVLVETTENVITYRPGHIIYDFTTETVFELKDKAQNTIFLKNVKSMVKIGTVGTNTEYPIRNMPHFMDLVDPELRDAYHEVEATLNHYVYHDNTAPFIGKNLIQKFGISNPSPRYIEAVSNAFQLGEYMWSDSFQTVSFGDGEWGSLSATIAAILLDREATSATLDSDPVHGALQEPILKVIRFMRSMEYKATPQDKMIYPILDRGTRDKIGQMVYEPVDQFGFFSPEYAPTGIFSAAALVSPESQVLTMKNIVGLVNGLFSLVRAGLNGCDGGLGHHIWTWGEGNWNPCRTWSNKNLYMPVGNHEKSAGYLSYSARSPSDSRVTIDDLSTLLTSGRMSDANKLIIESAYTSTLDSEGQDVALRVAQQLIAATPEFHSTNPSNFNGEARYSKPLPVPSSEPYKAIVFVFLFGGLDSFYMLAPHKDCALYTDYAYMRGGMKLPTNSMLDIDATQSDAEQPCENLGVHSELKAMKTIYDSGHGIFLANTGHMSKPVSKYNYLLETKTQLFSHHSMERETYYVDAFRNKPGTGVLGRMLDVMQGMNHSVGPIGINTNSPILEGDPVMTRPQDVIGSRGAETIYPRSVSNSNSKEQMQGLITDLNSQTAIDSGFYGDHWSQTLVDSIVKTDLIKNTANNAVLSQSFSGTLGDQLKMVSKLIKTQFGRGVNRDAFVLRISGFDHHANMVAGLNPLFKDINKGIDTFYKELQHQDMLNNVTFVLSSEFGRTITPNTNLGSDHGWGGNYFMFGGEMKGKKIMGQYPDGFKEDSSANDGRGRLVPTTSWESVWNGVAQWFGITEEEQLNYVLPNRGNFGCRLFTDQDLYHGASHTNEGCSGDQIVLEQALLLSEARYLTGEEQNSFCDTLVRFIKREVSNSTIRCVVMNQKVVLMETPGSRRLDENGIQSALLTFETQLSMDDTGNVADIVVKVNENKDEIVEELLSSGAIEDLAAMEETVLITLPPSDAPSLSPSKSTVPSPILSLNPSEDLSSVPSIIASFDPTQSQSNVPSITSSFGPSLFSSNEPSMFSSNKLSEDPSSVPSTIASFDPTQYQSNVPSITSSFGPSLFSSNEPSMFSSNKPSEDPSSVPSTIASFDPTESEDSSHVPSAYFSSLPSILPTNTAPHSSCAPCTNILTPWMEKNEKKCTNANILATKCNKNAWWTKNTFCQWSCFDNGNGYSEDECCEPSEDLSENPSKSPILAPSIVRTSVPSKTLEPAPCTQCSDVETGWMFRNNKDCTTTNLVLSKCNNTLNWKKNKYCQHSCFHAGNGYHGDTCC